MGYLQCDKCGGYYELQEGESPDDFSDTCECGGKLKYKDAINDNYSSEQPISDHYLDNPGTTYCGKCGHKNSYNAMFCKKCGSKLKKSKGKIEKFNSKINILAVFLGLLVSLIVLFVSSLVFYPFVASNQIDIVYFVLLTIACMLFIGGIVVGFLVGKKYSNGLINGGFLTLVTLVNFGSIIAVVWLVTTVLTAAISSIFGSSSDTSGYTDTASSTSSMDYTNTASPAFLSPKVILYLLLLLILIGMVIVAGPLGGMLGVFLRKQFKKYKK